MRLQHAPPHGAAQYNEALLSAALDGVAEALLGLEGTAVPEEALLGLLGPPVLGLLRASARIAAPIRSRALSLLLRTLDSYRDPSLRGAPGQVRLETFCSPPSTSTST